MHPFQFYRWNVTTIWPQGTAPLGLILMKVVIAEEAGWGASVGKVWGGTVQSKAPTWGHEGKPLTLVHSCISGGSGNTHQSGTCKRYLKSDFPKANEQSQKSFFYAQFKALVTTFKGLSCLPACCYCLICRFPSCSCFY